VIQFYIKLKCLSQHLEQILQRSIYF